MEPESTSWPSAAEFPHDNPEFDRGALWVRSALCFFASASQPAPASAPASAPEPATATATTTAKAATIATATTATATTTATAITIATETTIATATTTETTIATATTTETTTTATTATPTTTAPATPSNPLDTFVRVVTEVALAHGPAEIAAHIESLFHFGAFAAEALSPNVRTALCEGKILEPSDDDVRPTTSFASTRAAWEHILRGESGDLSACGDSTLDSWTADLVARLIASPDKAATIRRDLRRRGVAAFGMLD